MARPARYRWTRNGQSPHSTAALPDIERAGRKAAISLSRISKTHLIVASFFHFELDGFQHGTGEKSHARLC